jgi:hypothetical protein
MRKLLAVFLFLKCVTAAAIERHDESRDRLWRLTPAGVIVHEPGRTVRVPLPEWTYAGPSYGCVPSLGLGSDGEAVVSSDVVPVLWRIDPRTLAVTRHELRLESDGDKDVGFINLAWAAGAWLATSTADGAPWRIEATLRSARKLGPPGNRSTCRGEAGAAGASPAGGRRSRPW